MSKKPKKLIPKQQFDAETQHILALQAERTTRTVTLPVDVDGEVTVAEIDYAALLAGDEGSS